LRLGHMERVLRTRDWLAGVFSIADILMADVLRLVDRFDGLAKYPACGAYVARATARPAVVKSVAAPMAPFAAAVERLRAGGRRKTPATPSPPAPARRSRSASSTPDSRSSRGRSAPLSRARRRR